MGVVPGISGSNRGSCSMIGGSFFEQMKGYNFEQWTVGVFGVGHYHYIFTARAVNLFDPIFKVGDVVDLFAEQIRAWASGLA